MVLSRNGRLMALAGVTLLLLLTCWTAVKGMSRLEQTRAQAAALRFEKSQLQAQLPLVEQREAYATQMDEVRAIAARLGIDPARWTNRRVQRASSQISRQEAETLLGQQFGVQGRQWFAAERFDLSVTSPMAGLFTPPPPNDRGFNLEMVGVVYFPFEAP